MRDFWETIGKHPAAEFLIMPDRSFSYGNLSMFVRRFCAAFDRGGVSDAATVLILTKSEPIAIAAFVAALLDGKVPVMLAPDSTTDRVAAVVASVNPAVVVIDNERVGEAWANLRARIAVTEPPSAGRSWLGWAKGAELPVKWGDALGLPPIGRDPHLPANPEGLAYILFTSGTTQVPSGVRILRRNLLANLKTLQRLFSVTPSSRLFNDMALAHADGLVQGPLLAMCSGAAVIRSGGFEVAKLESWLDRVRHTRASHVITVPTIWAFIDRFASHDDYFDAPECAVLMSVAARMDEALWQRLEKRFRRPLINQYGLTETVASALYAGALPGMGAVATLGRPIDCEARLDPLADLADPAELQLCGDNIFPGYWQDEARSAASFTADGWLKTGDLARIRPDGSYELLGRLKAIINSGGLLIHPDEIDEAMLRHPSVSQSVTVGLPDAAFEEIAVTAVVIDCDVPETDLIAHARNHLETLKVPKRIIAVPTILRGISGKPNLEVLRNGLTNAIAAEKPAASQDDNLADAVLSLAAEVFRVTRDQVHPDSSPETLRGWDSFSQIALILEAEERFGIQIPTARAASLRSLAELMVVIQAAQA